MKASAITFLPSSAVLKYKYANYVGGLPPTYNYIKLPTAGYLDLYNLTSSIGTNLENAALNCYSVTVILIFLVNKFASISFSVFLTTHSIEIY